jgi:hypothetical protein
MFLENKSQLADLKKYLPKSFLTELTMTVSKQLSSSPELVKPPMFAKDMFEISETLKYVTLHLSEKEFIKYSRKNGKVRKC